MRAFIGIKLVDCISKINSIIEDLKQKDKYASYTKLNNIHITVEFLGEINEKDIEKIERIFSSLDFKFFEISLNRIENFKEMLILGVQNNKDLNLLQARINANLRSDGFLLQERKYFPHVTLARKTDIQIKENINLSSVIKEVILFSSARINNELVYKPILIKQLKE